MQKLRYWNVAVPKPIKNTFTYYYSEDISLRGYRVLVPFGKNNRLVQGIVVGEVEETTRSLAGSDLSAWQSKENTPTFANAKATPLKEGNEKNNSPLVEGWQIRKDLAGCFKVPLLWRGGYSVGIVGVVIIAILLATTFTAKVNAQYHTIQFAGSNPTELTYLDVTATLNAWVSANPTLNLSDGFIAEVDPAVKTLKAITTYRNI